MPLPDKPDHALDERLVVLRNSAYLQAYRLLSAVLVTPLLVLFIAADGFDLRVTADHVQTLFLVALAACTALPAMVVAWTEPEV